MSLPKLPFTTDKCLIGGRWIAPQTGNTIDLINPSDGSFLAPIAAGGAADIGRAHRGLASALENSSTFAKPHGKPALKLRRGGVNTSL